MIDVLDAQLMYWSAVWRWEKDRRWESILESILSDMPVPCGADDQGGEAHPAGEGLVAPSQICVRLVFGRLCSPRACPAVSFAGMQNATAHNSCNLRLETFC